MLLLVEVLFTLSNADTKVVVSVPSSFTSARMSGVSCRMPVSAINDAIELKVCVTVPEERT